MQPKLATLDRVTFKPLSARPLISIVVPSYNQGRFLRATLESILTQDYRPLEIHVIDGGSQDETMSVLDSYGDRPELKWLSECDKGVVDAVNKGFDRVQGDLVAIQSSDDCYAPGTLSRIVAAFQEHPAAGLIYGDSVKIDADGRELSRRATAPFTLENWFRIRTWIPQPSAFFRREWLDVIGGWNEQVPYAADTDLWLRMAFRAPVIKLNQFLSQRRMHGEQRDVHADRIVRDYTQMIDQSPEVAAAPATIRRLAHASKYLIRVRYNATRSDWAAAWSLMQAAACAPQTLDVRGIATHLCWLPARKWGSQLKRRLTIPAEPRTK